MALIVLALLLQDPSGEDLVRDLGHELIEVRERAHAQLLSLGPPAIPFLRKVAASADAELRLRATVVLEVVERCDRERAHDADQKAALLLLNRTRADIVRERSPGSVAIDGGRFNLSADAFGDGWVIATSVTDYLARRSDPGPGKGLLSFDVESITDAEARDLAIERCGFCSPRLVYLKTPSGKLTVRLKGDHVWFSPYSLEFNSPEIGHLKRVGNFTIEVTGIALRVSSGTTFPHEWTQSMETTCAVEFDPELKRKKVEWSMCGGGRYNIVCGVSKKKFWCDCPNGPQPIKPKPEGPYIKAIDVLPPWNFAEGDDEASGPGVALKDCSRITYTFWKPIKIPIDLTIEVPLR